MYKRTRTLFALIVAAVMLLSGCSMFKSDEERFDEYLDGVFKESVICDTLTLHYTLANPEAYDIEAPEPTFGEVDLSEEAIAEDIAEVTKDIEELQKFDYNALTAKQQDTYDLLMDTYETTLEFYDHIYFYEPFAYTSGLQANLPISLAEYKFYDEDDVLDYLALVEQVDEYVEAHLEFEKVKSQKGYFMSEESASEVIRQCEEYIASPENNLLIDTFSHKIEDVEGIDEAKAAEYSQENKRLVMENVIPAYENIISVFTKFKVRGKNDLGLAGYDGGKEYYKYLLKSYTGSSKTPEEVIEVLDDAMEDALDEYLEIATQDYENYITYLISLDELYSEADPEETVLFFKETMGKRFPDMPEVGFKVEPVHESLEDIVSPAFYMLPALDAYEDNSIYINYGSDSASTLWSTLAHEGIPGHMYQRTYFLSGDPHPVRTLLSYDGYSEGWATYVEMMSFEYYEYAEECFAEYERIDSEMSMIISARIDIGVNYEGWTAEDAAAYLDEHGFDSSAAKDVMKYVIAEPANYQMYCLGWLEFEALRDEAEVRLGDAFNEVEFHKLMLDAGPCTFDMLESKLDDYILNK